MSPAGPGIVRSSASSTSIRGVAKGDVKRYSRSSGAVIDSHAGPEPNIASICWLNASVCVSAFMLAPILGCPPGRYRSGLSAETSQRCWEIALSQAWAYSLRRCRDVLPVERRRRNRILFEERLLSDGGHRPRWSFAWSPECSDVDRGGSPVAPAGLSTSPRPGPSSRRSFPAAASPVTRLHARKRRRAEAPCCSCCSSPGCSRRWPASR